MILLLILYILISLIVAIGTSCYMYNQDEDLMDAGLVGFVSGCLWPMAILVLPILGGGYLLGRIAQRITRGTL